MARCEPASSARRLVGRAKLDDEEDGLLDKVDEMLEPVDDLLDKVDEMLDRPFYDPSQDEDSWLSKLSGGDAELAGTLFASGFLALMVVVSQELVRWYKYGANYVPFRPGGGGGCAMTLVVPPACGGCTQSRVLQLV